MATTRRIVGGSVGGGPGGDANVRAGMSSSARSSGRARRPIDLGQALVQAFLTNERIKQVLIELLAPEIWRVFQRRRWPPARGRWRA